MFDVIEIPFQHESLRNSIKLRPFSGGILYRRVTGDIEIRKRLYSKGSTIRLSPVKPFNCPKMITSNLMIELKRSLILSPGATKKVYLRFPVEIGVIVTKEEKERVVDVFTDNSPKYSMYGDIRDGVMCRYYSSDVHIRPPKIDPSIEGLMEVRIKNTTSEFREVAKLVFDGLLMKIFYSDDIVSSRVIAKIIDDEKVEIRFSKKSPRDGQKKAFEMLNRSTFKRMVTKFTMEGGY